ncbi:hypothetical protein DM02DRAFT_212196 [Periconia macrospinosa]|uniref:Uncharacterized protein n=1 Tax=Periconia macrospinosa TaxID=97972 RepID=A0A2V1D6X1_9PLEO|nr:hypothetical protein DM02DRAFT_212196 [Periconia macrospinosa]
MLRWLLSRVLCRASRYTRACVQLKPVRKELSEELVAFSERDNGLHPAVVHQAIEEGKITVNEEEHKRWLLELRKNKGCWRPGEFPG